MSGASGALANDFQAAIDKFTQAVNKISAAVSTMAVPAATPLIETQAGVTPSPSPGMQSGALAGTIAAGLGAGGGLPQTAARTALSYAPAPVSAAVGGLASAGAQGQPSQIALNTLQYQSALSGQSYNTTRIGALGTAGTALGGQQQIPWGFNPQDMAATYATLQQTTGQLNPWTSTPGAQNVMGAMGAMNIANPAMSGQQNSSALQSLYSPQTSMNMMMMGYPVTPRQAGTGKQASLPSIFAPLMDRLGGGKAMSQNKLAALLAPGMTGATSLSNLTGASQGSAQYQQYANLVEMQNTLMTGNGGKAKDMSLSQISALYNQMGSKSVPTQNAAKDTLSKYGISQSDLQALKSQAGSQAENTSDTSQGYTAGMQTAVRLLSDFNTGLHKFINSLPGARGILGTAESFATNILGGGSNTMYDSTEPDSAPTTLLPGTASPLMIAYYVSAFAAPTKSKFPSGTQFVTIDQRGNHTEADVVDMESGAVFPASAVNSWLKKAGGNKVVYATPSNKAALDATKPPAYSWWAAEWDNSQTVPAGAVAHQFKSGGSYDTSVVSNPGAFNGQGGGGSSPAASPAAGGTSTTSTSTPSGGVGGLSAGLGDYATEGSTSELSAFNSAIMGGGLGGGGSSSTTTTTTAAAPAAGPAAAPAAGGKTMYDTQYPSIVPSSADLVVSYVDGPQASNFGQAQTMFGSRALSITWTGENADIADVETSFPLSKLPAWIDAQVARGIPKPVVYAIYSGVGTNYAQVKQAVGTKSVSYWLSDWTGKPHSLPGADAVQYGAQASPSSPMITDPGKAGGKTYDLSAVATSFPYYGGAPKLTPPAKHSGQAEPVFTTQPMSADNSGITIHFPVGSVNASDPTEAAKVVVGKLKAELVRMNLVKN